MKWGVLALISIIVLACGVFYIWASSTVPPTEELRELVDVAQVKQDDAAVFEPSEESKNDIGVILYPGAKVENTAYSYYAKGLMAQGYTVIIPEMRFNFALFDADRASQFIEQFKEIEQWVIGGHSLGGVAAAIYAAEHEVAGLLFLGAYPSSSTNLTKQTFPVLSLYAEFDGLTLLEDIEDSKSLLPKQTVFVEILGGNHAQFGMYGEQKGDLPANISAVEQQEKMIEITLNWLAENNLQ